MQSIVATDTCDESLTDILARLETRYVLPASAPSASGQAGNPLSHGPRDTPPLAVPTPTPWPAETMAIPAEVFLETLGFFTPSSKRIRGIYTKEKVVGERMAEDGTRHLITTKLSANHELGLPITANHDYYRAFLKILADTIEREGRLRLPLAVPIRHLLHYAEKADGIHTRREVRTFLKKMVPTGIEGGVYQVKSHDFTEGFVTTVFRQVIMRGEALRHGQIANTNYVWPAPWFLANYLRGYVRRVDLALHNRLRKPIAKALYPLLATGWYASEGQPYVKRYTALCAEFFLTTHQALSLIKQQLDPAHLELQALHFLDTWTYRKAVDQQGWILGYWPGRKFFQEQTIRENHPQPPLLQKTPKAPGVPPGSTTDNAQLLADILAVCGDRQNSAAYRKAIREHPDRLLRMALAETRQAANEQRIGKTRGAFFFDTLHRLTTLRTP